MEATVLVLNSLEYSITENGRTIDGVKVHYIQEGNPDTSPDKKGFDVFEGSLPFEEKANVRAVPGWYRMGFVMSAKKDKNGRSVNALKPASIRFVGNQELKSPGEKLVVNNVAPSAAPSNGMVGAR